MNAAPPKTFIGKFSLISGKMPKSWMDTTFVTGDTHLHSQSCSLVLVYWRKLSFLHIRSTMMFVFMPQEFQTRPVPIQTNFHVNGNDFRMPCNKRSMLTHLYTSALAA